MARTTISTVSGIDNDKNGIIDDAGNSESIIPTIDGNESSVDSPSAGFGGTASNSGSETGTDAYAASDAPIERKRKPRSEGSGRGRSTAKKTAHVDLNKNSRAIIAKNVVAMHAMVDAALGVKGLFGITNEQGAQLTNAVMDVMELYDFTPSPKVAAWCNLCAVLGIVYYPKVDLIMTLKKQAAQQQRQNVPVQSVVMPEQAGTMQFN